MKIISFHKLFQSVQFIKLNKNIKCFVRDFHFVEFIQKIRTTNCPNSRF